MIEKLNGKRSWARPSLRWANRVNINFVGCASGGGYAKKRRQRQMEECTYTWQRESYKDNKSLKINDYYKRVKTKVCLKIKTKIKIKT